MRMKTKAKTATSGKSKKAPSTPRDLKPKKDAKGGNTVFQSGASGGVWKAK